MPRDVAIAVYLSFIVWLFVRSRRWAPMASPALLIPLVWLAIIGSRPVSFWIQGEASYSSPAEYLEGSPMDAGVFLVLLLLGAKVLGGRKLDWATLVATNRLLMALFVFGLVSCLWSDYPVVALKRWIKDAGNVVMALIILTERNRSEAIKAVLLRFAYLAVPLSVLWIKYVPELGRMYNRWTWEPMLIGVTDDKNALGAIAMISGLVLVWALSEARARRGSPIPAASATHGSACSAPGGAVWRPVGRAEVVSHLLLLVMVLWLIHSAESSNSLLCFYLGVAVMMILRRSTARNKRTIRRLGRYGVLAALALLVVLSIPGLLDGLFELLGEDSTLTGRTDLWADLLAEPINPIVGMGYQSFWLGSGAERMIAKYAFHPNQAHNGFLETYLNLGLVGLSLILGALLAGGAKLKTALMREEDGAILLFCFLVATVFYNWSEAMFGRMSPVWAVLLLALLYVPIGKTAGIRVRKLVTIGENSNEGSWLRAQVNKPVGISSSTGSGSNNNVIW